jgi:hypothetical protein
MSYPVSLRIDMTRARCLYQIVPAEMRIKTEKHGFTMENHPIKIQLDNEGFFGSLGIKSLKQQSAETAQKAKQAVSDFMGRKAEEKNAMLGPDGLTIAQIKAARFVQRPEAMTLTFIPDQRPEISWRDGYLDIEYRKDDLDISWIPGDVYFTYCPYSVKFSVDRWSDDPGLAKK